VTRGLAGIKLSGSPSKYGLINVSIINEKNKKKKPTKSLNE
jgi:hypothetical protein